MDGDPALGGLVVNSPDDALHAFHMRRCLELARLARASGDTAVGALVVQGGRVVAEGVESVNATHDITAHAEVVALRKAGSALRRKRLTDCVLYTTVEPCVMCAYAIRLAGVGAVVAGAPAGDINRHPSGWFVLTSPDLFPDASPPSFVRNVLGQECQRTLTDQA